MNDNTDRINQLSPLKRALLAMEDMQARIDALERAQREPVAIIGLGCRFPGANNPQEFWKLLLDGVDAIREVPSDRWDISNLYDANPGTPGKMITRWGGFLDRVDLFDAQLFGISPREAVRMDPQQRLLLEVVWEALESAGQPIDKLAGSNTGVYIGISNNDYSLIQFDDLDQLDVYAGTGNAFSIAANRISYFFDLHGPSVIVDTACSSSLVSTHLAVQSLRRGESDLAIAGGVNLILSPELTITFSMAHMMAADGRCKTFDASADGYVRGEGCGILILKRLTDAFRDQDHILAVIYGSATNQDGRSNGLTAPNGLAQQQVINAAIADAGLTPSLIDYVEAHGTGTILGDPIEMRALANVMKTRSKEDSCWVGSVKTNVGHLEAAAGVAGIIKVVLSLQNEIIPPHLHLNQVNPYIGLEEMPLAIPTSRQPWTSRLLGKASQVDLRFAGVSSFGFGGTNAHLILGEAPAQTEKKESGVVQPGEQGGFYEKLERPIHLLTLSASNETAVRMLAERYASLIENHQVDHPSLELADICYTANAGRSRMDYRLAITAVNRDELAKDLRYISEYPDLFLESNSTDGGNRIELPEVNATAAIDPSYLLGENSRVGKYSRFAYAGCQYGSNQPKIAFLFTGQGAQYQGMGRVLYESQPDFQKNVDRCLNILDDQGLDAPLGVSMAEVMFGDPKSDMRLIDETVYTQPALFILEYALGKMWESWGVKPDYLIGHSVGEYVAACLAGVFSLEDGLKLIATRGRLMQSLPAGGGMAAIFADENFVNAALSAISKRVAIAAINGPNHTVISGELKVIQDLIDRFTAQGINARSIKVSHAFHSPLLDPILDEFELVARKIDYHPAQAPLVSNLTGRIFSRNEMPMAQYWKNHMRQPVQFLAGMRTLAEQGVDCFLEIGPSPVLTGMGKRCLPAFPAFWLASLKPDTNDWDTTLGSLAHLYISGYKVNWEGFDQGYSQKRQRLPATLPNYPFQRERHWYDSTHLPGERLQLKRERSWIGSQSLDSINSDQSESLTDLPIASLEITSKSSDPDSEVEIQSSPLISFSRNILAGLGEDQQLEMLIDQIRAQIAQVLRLEPARIDLKRPLNYLGLDSIMAIEFKNQIERNLGINFSLASLLQGPTIVNLAQQILVEINSGQMATTELTPEGDLRRPGLIPGSGDQIIDELGEFPLSFGQRALWFQHQLSPDSVFNPAYAARVHTQLDTQVLDEIIQLLVQRHSALRTTFTYRNGEPRSHINDVGNIHLERYELSETTWVNLRTRLAEEVDHSFDLVNGPLFRIIQFKKSTTGNSKTESVLLLVAHHIIVDMWSLALLINELAELFTIRSSGNQIDATSIRPIRNQYSDYVHWQSELLASSSGFALWEYWRNRLSGDLPVLDFPTDWSRPSVQTYHGAIRSTILNENLTRRLRALSESQGVTLYTTLLAAFKVLLFRYTGQEDLIVGTPTMGRSQAEFADLVGYFVNPVPIRSRISADIAFSDYLIQVQQSVIGALEHQDYPIALLAEKIRPDRDPSRLPIFQVMFILQRAHLLNQAGLSQFAVNLDGLEMNLAGLSVETYALDTQKSQFDLTLIMAETKDGLGASLTYNTDLFHADTIDRLLEHYRIILEHLTINSDQSMGQIPLLSDDERSHLLVGINDTVELIWPEFARQVVEESLTAHALFEHQVNKSPSKIAIIYGEQKITYAELNSKANRLAHYLQVMGVGPDTIVGICVERSIEMIVGLLAVLKAGGAYLPIDPIYPIDRIAFMIQDAGIPILLTQSDLLERLPTLVAQIIYLDTSWENITKTIILDQRDGQDLLKQLENNNLDENPISQVGGANLAYVIYTSGSTGRSKGVLLEHRGLINVIWAHIRGFAIDHTSRQLQFASFSFDASVSEIFTALLSGASLYLAKRDTLSSMPELFIFLRDNRITSVTLPPSVLMMLPHGELTDLQTVVSAGENCTPEIALNWAPGRRFINAYGPTEATIGPTYFPIDGRELSRDELAKQFLRDRYFTNGFTDRKTGDLPSFMNSVSIGRPISNVEIYILDQQKQLVPMGMAGEIYIGGTGIARGYLNRPELTSEKFIANPFKSKPGSRLYRTGDLARYLKDGNIEFLGRVDFQVKIRGFRIELEEVESVISQHPNIQQAAVIVAGKSIEEKRLAAYIVIEKETSFSINDLRIYLRGRLPEYMVPASFLLMDSLPLSPSGKVDRKSLPDANGSRPDLEAVYLPPQTETERIIASVWQEVLGIDKVGLNDNFFDLGGHSLLLFKAHSLLQERLQRNLVMVELFRYPTVHLLAEYISEDITRRGNQEKASLQKSQDRADQQREAVKRQVERMRDIAQNRGALANQSNNRLKTNPPQTSKKK